MAGRPTGFRHSRMDRTFFQRCQDVAFRLRRDALRREAETVDPGEGREFSGSVSGASAWVRIARAVVEGRLPGSGIRSHPAVFDIVETVGPTDGIHYARLIRAWDSEISHGEDFERIDSWGDPLRWPAKLLGFPRPASPTSLRYLATALWLARRGLVRPGLPVIEIGVGFGGLAACNHLVSGSTTTLIDLPPVEALAARMLEETLGLNAPRSSTGATPPEDFCLVSNYAFTELSCELQDEYIETWVRHAPRGLIVSNAAVFSDGIEGRSDEELLAQLREAGLPAHLDREDAMLCPTDRHFGVSLIYWDRS